MISGSVTGPTPTTQTEQLCFSHLSVLATDQALDQWPGPNTATDSGKSSQLKTSSLMIRRSQVHSKRQGMQGEPICDNNHALPWSPCGHQLGVCCRLRILHVARSYLALGFHRRLLKQSQQNGHVQTSLGPATSRPLITISPCGWTPRSRSFLDLVYALRSCVNGFRWRRNQHEHRLP